MESHELDRLLAQVRRIEGHREKGTEKEIRTVYQTLMKDLRHYLADEYSRYAENDQLTYDILQRNGYYARFLDEVEQKINDISPEVKRTIRGTVEQTYEYTYNGLIDCVKKAAEGTELGMLKACTPDVIRRAVENPISKLTLNDRLEKHRKDIVYNIKQDISVGLTNGDRYSTMAKRISRSVEGNYKKAITIARTETHRVREAGNHDAALSVDEALKTGGSGMRMMKTWKTMKDERVRPAKAKGRNRQYNHREMEGVTVPVEEEFILPSGAKTVAPGQSGVAGEDINCRCYLSYGLQKVKGNDIVDTRNYHAMDEEEFRASRHSITKEERSIIYGKNHFSGYVNSSKAKRINDILRSKTGSASLDDVENKIVSTLQKVIDKNVIEGDIIVSRYVKSDALESITGIAPPKVSLLKPASEYWKELEALPDKFTQPVTYTEKGFLSTSGVANQNVMQKKEVLLNIKVKSGTHGYITTNNKESEIIFGQNSKITVNKVSIKNIGSSDHKIVLDCEMG